MDSENTVLQREHQTQTFPQENDKASLFKPYQQFYTRFNFKSAPYCVSQQIKVQGRSQYVSKPADIAESIESVNGSENQSPMEEFKVCVQNTHQNFKQSFPKFNSAESSIANIKDEDSLLQNETYKNWINHLNLALNPGENDLLELKIKNLCFSWDAKIVEIECLARQLPSQARIFQKVIYLFLYNFFSEPFKASENCKLLIDLNQFGLSYEEFEILRGRKSYFETIPLIKEISVCLNDFFQEPAFKINSQTRNFVQEASKQMSSALGLIGAVWNFFEALDKKYFARKLQRLLLPLIIVDNIEHTILQLQLASQKIAIMLAIQFNVEKHSNNHVYDSAQFFATSIFTFLLHKGEDILNQTVISDETDWEKVLLAALVTAKIIK